MVLQPSLFDRPTYQPKPGLKVWPSAGGAVRPPKGIAPFSKFWKQSAKMVSPNWVNWGAGHPLMGTARLALVGGLGVTAFSGARTTLNRARNRDYAGALTAGAVTGGAGYLAYHYGLQGGSVRNHLRLAARAGSSLGNYLKQMSSRVRI